MRFERHPLTRDLTARTGIKVPSPSAAGFFELLTFVGRDADWHSVRQVAYFLATVRWETAHTFTTVAERRASTKQPELRALQDRYWSTGYYGRGLVQLTWKRNYARAGERLAGRHVVADGKTLVIAPTTFVDDPDLLLEAEPSYLVAAEGMRGGWFTGKKLGDYIVDGAPPDYRNARRIINGLDRADDIAVMAMQFELLLRAARVPS